MELILLIDSSIKLKGYIWVLIRYTIKIHSSEPQGQKGKKHTPNQKNVTTTVSHLHDGMGFAIFKILHHICMVKF